MSSKSNHIEKLSKAPLQEVIFEAFWELDINSDTKQLYDPGYEFAQGIFASMVREQFPVNKRLIPATLPLFMANHRPVHQFWTDEEKWPVLQLGPGLLTVNDTEKTYIWETEFKPVIEFGLETVLKSYQEMPRFEKATLRYIDAVELESENEDNFIKFIEKNLQIQIIKKFEISGAIQKQSINQVYKLENGSSLHLTVSDGKRNNKPAVVWQTAIMIEKYLTDQEIKKWVQEAHSVISDLFKRMLRKEYYDSLK